MSLLRRWRPDAIILMVVAVAVMLPWLHSMAVTWAWGPIAPTPQACLVHAAGVGDVAGLSDALRSGVSPDIGAGSWMTPLMSAAARGDLRVVQALLNAGADANATDPYGNTALFYAAMFDRTEVAQTLLDYGADPLARNDNGETPLDRAIEFRASATATILRDAENDHRFLGCWCR
ncbi:MAG TPA: ankyrin repeat domain-containing protein [Tepidisphaeraceae bacterium]|jgi:ankyrin repeat protein